MFVTARKALLIFLTLIIGSSFAGLTVSAPALAKTKPAKPTKDYKFSTSNVKTSYHCGDKDHGGPVKVSINIGCEGKGNPILDMLFAFIRFLSYGAGLVIIGSLIWAGIQYTASRGDPQTTAAAKGRIDSAIIALLIFIFAYALLDYVIPGAVLK
jgi:Type IV secretion system pilin